LLAFLVSANAAPADQPSEKNAVERLANRVEELTQRIEQMRQEHQQQIARLQAEMHADEMLAGSLLWIEAADVKLLLVVFAATGLCFYLLRRPLRRVSEGYRRGYEDTPGRSVRKPSAPSTRRSASTGWSKPNADLRQ